jgi:hypothetical protein
MSVVFKTFEVIEIDGIAAGNIVDVISNHASKRAEVLAAFGVYVAELQTEINGEKATLEANLSELTAQLSSANARVAELLAGMPFNPRVMEASAFIARISSQELLLLASSSDPMLQQIIGMLNQWKENDWPIVLDSPEIQQAVGYLAQQGIVAESRIAEVLRDCTREESYVADE